MANISPITQARLKEVLSYDPATGVFTWLISRGRAKAGSVAGSPGDHGYWQIGIDGHRYYSHRLAFLFMTGEFPPNDVDHRDRNPSDNRWDELRPATRSQNRCNSKPSGVSRFKGVAWHKRAGKWMAQAWINDKHHHLGYHTTEVAAAAAYAAFAAKHFPDFARLE